MSEEGYTDITILEANRLSSEEGKSQNDSNNALYTNKVNNGLKLKVGDKVSLHSAFISEIGAEGGEIEIKGRESQNGSKTLVYNETTHTKLDGTMEITSATTESGSLSFSNYYWVNKREEKTYHATTRDDTIDLVMNPYKNANGEHYISLPWNFRTPMGGQAQIKFDSWDRDYSILKSFPSNALPATWEPHLSAGSAIYWGGNVVHIPSPYSYSLLDKRQYTVSVSQNASQVSILNDNSRYSIYQRRGTAYGLTGAANIADWTSAIGQIEWGKDVEGNPIAMTNASYLLGDYQDKPAPAVKLQCDLALHPYVRVKNKVQANAKQGFNSPEDVASSLTEDVQRVSRIETIKHLSSAGGELILTMIGENEVNKVYGCANPVTYSHIGASNAHRYDGSSASTALGDTETFAYMTQYQTIGVKRPDLYDLGRLAFSSAGALTENALHVGLKPLDPIQTLETSVPWTADNIELINNLFVAQKLYPEIFQQENLYETNWLNASAENQRFLHMNMSASNSGFLGYDLTESGHQYYKDTFGVIIKERQDQTYCSSPIFININPSTEFSDINSSLAQGQDFERSVYGWAIKKNDKIAFQIENLSLAFGSVLAVIPAGYRVGWDYHFTAFGCPTMLLYNGFLNASGDAFNEISATVQSQSRQAGTMLDLSVYIDRIYLGSPDTSVSYNPNENRFQIQELHRSEVIGNLYNAGFDASLPYNVVSTSLVAGYTAPLVSVPDNSQSATKVYKLNKQLLANNFSPTMAPYNNTVNLPLYSGPQSAAKSASLTHTQPMSFLNPNIQPQTLYDSQCGNYILDWGVEEKYWRESLWNILGFRYSQIIGTDTENKRLNNSNDFSNMKTPTTNADITNSDFVSLTRNVYDAPNYNLTPPSANLPAFQSSAAATAAKKETFYPEVSVTQTTGQVLRAEKLPTRTLRPYFTIRSDIVGDVNYFGSGDSGIPLPVVAVVDKVSNSGDYFFTDDQSLQFTITKPTTLTSITTSIHDPDGSYSSVDPNSAVLYKVQRNIVADMNPVQTILSNIKSKKERVKFEESLN